MPKDLSIEYHILDLIGTTLDRKFAIEILKKYPQVDLKKLEQAAKHNQEVERLLKEIRREQEQK